MRSSPPRLVRSTTPLLCFLIIHVLPPSDARGADPVQVTTQGGYEPAPSRDGNWIAFQYGGGIAKTRADGSDFTQLTVSGGDLDWGRPGNLIVFADYYSRLFTVDAVTAETTHVWTGCAEHPAWSPVADEIAVQCPGLAIVHYPYGPSTSRSCGNGCSDVQSMTWSPDGQWLSTDHQGAIWKIPRANGPAEILTGDRCRFPDWSPDGRWIAFSKQFTPIPPPDGSYPYNIWVVDARGESFGKAQITFGAFHDLDPAWSPDGASIYFGSDRSGGGQIWKVAFDATVRTRAGTWGRLKAIYR